MTEILTNIIENEGLEVFKQRCYLEASKHKYACILDSCQLNTGVYAGDYELIVALGAEEIIDNISHLEQNIVLQKDWYFGILGYDLKNNFEHLESKNKRVFDTPDLFFFKPRTLIAVDKQLNVEIIRGTINPYDFSLIPKTSKAEISEELNKWEKGDYIKKIKEIQDLILEGEVYELNYCLPFEHNVSGFNPFQFQVNLLKKSPVPMASFLRIDQTYLCGASMERNLKKEGNLLFSQPIKGTIKKSSDLDEDALLIKALEDSEKDKAENVMIVDLVRNDLGRICETGSIKVNELFGIYSYLQVHQMISTVSGQLKSRTSFTDILRASFPMGSMTGAPKISAMKNIESLEDFKRGWYSGSVGYIKPNGDFDLNVVIRSAIFDQEQSKLAYFAGGAITIDSNPESEWKEVKLKTKAISELLTS